MPTDVLIKNEHRLVEESPPVARPVPPDARVRRLKLSVVAWGVWTILITTLWIAHEGGGI